MQQIDFEQQRKILDREITFFHFARAKKRIERNLALAKKANDRFFIYYFLAQDEIIHEHFRLAIYYLDKAIDLRKDDGCSYNDRALCLAELGKYELALKWFNQGIAKDQDCASLYHNKGWLLNALDKHSQAIVCFHKALELESQRPEAWYSLADSLLALGHTRQAVKAFRKALELVATKSSYVRAIIEKRLKSIEK